MRRMKREGKSISEIARATGRSWPTVKKWLEAKDLSPKPPVAKARPSKLDPYKPKIDRILAEDMHQWRKQRHTAKRIWERLRDEDGADVSQRTVSRYVRKRKQELTRELVGFLDLVWAPGEAQADFGEADVFIKSQRTRVHYFVLVFPHSNVGICQVFPAENAECCMEGLKACFEWLGGVPRRVVFDRASGIAKVLADGSARRTEAFSRFCAHYGFEARFCNAASGWEKGCVEAKVGHIRRELFTPVPSTWTLQRMNEGLFEKCLALSDKDHYAKGVSELCLFEEDRLALLGLPEAAFDVVRWETRRADGYGKVTLGGRHRYSSDPALAGRILTVGIGAWEVRVIDEGGELVCVHERAYGDAPTDTTDPASQLPLICNRPASWANSRVREELPEEVSRFIDSVPEADRRAALRALRDVTAADGWQAAASAAGIALESAGRIDEATLAIAAAWVSGSGPVAYEEEVDLRAYDLAVGLGVA